MSAADYHPEGPWPQPNVYLAPAPAPAPAQPQRLTFHQILTLLVVTGAMVIGGLFAYGHAFTPATPSATVDIAKVARVLPAELGSAYGDGCLAIGAAVGSGKTMIEGQKSLQEAFLASRTTAFTIRVMPELTKILPEGTEPTTAAQRAEVAQFWTNLGHALKGNK